MNIVEHELKRYDMWQDELEKKNKAYILIDMSREGAVAVASNTKHKTNTI